MKRRDFLKSGLFAMGAAIIPGALATRSESAVLSDDSVDVVRPDRVGGFYSPNRAPLAPSAFMKLPVGSVTPKGWLRQQLVNQAEGLNGRMTEVSDFLDITKTGWVVPTNHGFEEVGYWYRGFAPLGYVLNDNRIIEATRQWAVGIMATQTADGWFGPTGLRASMEGGPDLWPHMPVMFGLQSYYEFTNDPQVLRFLTAYFRFQNTLPVKVFGAGWGCFRWGDNIDSIYWLYNRTGDAFLLGLVHKIHDNSATYWRDIPTYHNVNLSQGFREPAQYGLLEKDPKFLAATDRVYDTIMANFGQFPGGGFAGDEGCRPGFIDPRQGFETCGIAEIMQSFEIMTLISGDPKWSERCERIAFNLLPAALDPLQKGCHYLTSANSVMQLAKSPIHKQLDDGPGMQLYKPGVHDYRCCPHNYGMAWPKFVENAWLATADNGLCASFYSPSEVKAMVGGGTAVKIVEETDYPFRDTIRLILSTPGPVTFPLYLRIPEWADQATIRVNGVPIGKQPTPHTYAIVKREWKQGDVVDIHFPMTTRVTHWTHNKNSASVDRGPLTYSLAIREEWHQYAGTAQWPEYELKAASDWNYGLCLDPKQPEKTLDVLTMGGDVAPNPFTPETVPVAIHATARKIDAWRLDDDQFMPMLQQSPARSDAPAEQVRLIPMGAARIRLTSFPTVEAHGSDWRETARFAVRITASQPQGWPWAVEPLLYGTQPSSSYDLETPRMVLRDHGAQEWVQIKFPVPARVSNSSVYWFDDQDKSPAWYPESGYTKVPKSWCIEYRDSHGWKPVSGASDYEVATDRPCRVTFDPITTIAIRLKVLPDRRHVSLYSWTLSDEDVQLVPTDTASAVKLLSQSLVASKSTEPVTRFDAADLKNVIDGGAVPLWLDRSPGANDASSAGKNPPTWVPSGINNRPSVRFDGSRAQYFVFDRSVQDDFTIAVVFQSKQGIGTGTAYFAAAGLVQGEVPGVANDFGLSLNAAGQVCAGTGNPDTSVASSAGFNDGRSHLAIFVRERSTGAFTLFVDGVKAAQGSGGTQSLTAPAQLGIGAQTNGANCFTGDIGEIVMFSRVLPPAERMALEGALSAKWGVQSNMSM